MSRYLRSDIEIGGDDPIPTSNVDATGAGGGGAGGGAASLALPHSQTATTLTLATSSSSLPLSPFEDTASLTLASVTAFLSEAASSSAPTGSHGAAIFAAMATRALSEAGGSASAPCLVTPATAQRAMNALNQRPGGHKGRALHLHPTMPMREAVTSSAGASERMLQGFLLAAAVLRNPRLSSRGASGSGAGGGGGGGGGGSAVDARLSQEILIAELLRPAPASSRPPVYSTAAGARASLLLSSSSTSSQALNENSLHNALTSRYEDERRLPFENLVRVFKAAPVANVLAFTHMFQYAPTGVLKDFSSIDTRATMATIKEERLLLLIGSKELKRHWDEIQHLSGHIVSNVGMDTYESLSGPNKPIFIAVSPSDKGFGLLIRLAALAAKQKRGGGGMISPPKFAITSFFMRLGVGSTRVTELITHALRGLPGHTNVKGKDQRGKDPTYAKRISRENNASTSTHFWSTLGNILWSWWGGRVCFLRLFLPSVSPLMLGAYLRDKKDENSGTRPFCTNIAVSFGGHTANAGPSGNAPNEDDRFIACLHCNSGELQKLAASWLNTGSNKKNPTIGVASSRKRGCSQCGKVSRIPSDTPPWWNFVRVWLQKRFKEKDPLLESFTDVDDWVTKKRAYFLRKIGVKRKKVENEGEKEEEEGEEVGDGAGAGVGAGAAPPPRKRAKKAVVSDHDDDASDEGSDDDEESDEEWSNEK